MVKRFLVMLFAAFLLFPASGASAGERRITERPVAQTGGGGWVKESFRVSPDGRRVAFVSRMEKKWTVLLD